MYYATTLSIGGFKFYSCVPIHLSLCPTFSFSSITWVSHKKIICDIYTRSETIKRELSLISDFSTFSVMELCPLICRKVHACFNWKWGHPCPIETFFNSLRHKVFFSATLLQFPNPWLHKFNYTTVECYFMM